MYCVYSPQNWIIPIITALVILLLSICKAQEAASGCKQPRNLIHQQDYYTFLDSPQTDNTHKALRGSDDIYYGTAEQDVIFNITAPNHEVVEVSKICLFARNVRYVNVRSTAIYGVLNGTLIQGTGALEGQELFDPTFKWEKVCIKPIKLGKVNQVSIQLQIRNTLKKKVRVQKLTMEACAALN